MKKMISLISAAAITVSMVACPMSTQAQNDVNLFLNGDYEQGEFSPTELFTSNAEMEVVTDEVYEGEYALKIKNRTNQTGVSGQTVHVEAGKTYIFSGYAKVDDGTATKTQYPLGLYFFDPSAGLQFETVYGDENITVSKEEDGWKWERFVKVVKADTDGSAFLSLVLWKSGRVVADYYVDDLYFGELDVSDMELSVPENIDIPPSGEKSALLSATAYNQLGGTEGTEGVSILWELAEETDGVRIEEDRIVISSEAAEGDVEIIASAVSGDTVLCTRDATLHLTLDDHDAFSENLFVNGDFETGSAASITASDGAKLDFEISSEEHHDGSFSLKISNRKDQSCRAGQRVDVEAGKVYIFSGYAKVDDSAGNTHYPLGLSFSKATDGLSFTRIGGDAVSPQATQIHKGTAWKWERFVNILEASADGSVHLSLNLWQDGDTPDYYIDDMYFGELKVCKLNATVPEEIDIPKSGETKVTLAVDPENPVGDKHGLDNASVEWSLAAPVQGVRIDGDALYVDDTACAGIAEISANAKAYEGDSGTSKVYRINLIPHDDLSIYVSNVVLRGTVEEDAVLELSYDYRQVLGEADASEIKWYYGERLDGEFIEIEGAKGTTYKVPEEYIDKFIKAVIYPKSSAGREAEPVSSNCVTVPTSPAARNITVSGEMFTGNEISVNYEFYDVNLDDEDKEKTVIRWQRKGKNGFEDIDGADSEKYTLTDADTDAVLRIKVIPVSQNEPNHMEEFFSEEIKGPTAPIATNLKITLKGNTYYGTYDYHHEHSFVEGDSVLTWYVGNAKIGTGAAVKAPDKNTTLTFEVIPKSSKAPETGKAVRASVQITTASTGSSGGSGGSGGGFISQSPISSVIDESKIIKDETDNGNKISIVDMDGHWAKDAAQKVIDMKIMAPDANGNFNPSEIVLRRDIVFYAAKTAGLQKTEYKNIFEDVSADDEIAGYLQTLVDNGIISSDTSFRPQDYMKRTEFAAILVRIAELKGIAASGTYIEYADAASIMDWAKPYVKKAAEFGLMCGNADHTFNPNGSVNKAELATVLVRLVDMVK